ncbi:YbhB/YbcL family Raf kinase inhibitor-like protein [Mycetocola saprophilus]|uniref:YbhB/YbcL family Raf kinase inhibitor-like protein n=1 Tax=Mycetocola saprophilus TaxID=76636 RepID=UPI003BF257FB
MTPFLPGSLLRGVRASESRSIIHDPALRTPNTFTLTSSAFIDGGRIPRRHAGTGVGDNVSPALSWHGAPRDTAAYLLIVEDTDVPLPRPLIHSLTILDLPREALVEGALARDAHDIHSVPAGFGRRGYAGPRPLPGHGEHRYGFHLFALDAALDPTCLPDSRRALLRQVSGHVGAAAYLYGVASHEDFTPRNIDDRGGPNRG